MKLTKILLTGIVLWSSAITGFADGEVLQESSWTKKTYAIKGVAELKKEDGNRWLILKDDFKTKNAPDLKLFLSPIVIANISSDNVLDGAVLIAPLKKNKRGQSYLLPEGTDLSQFKSIVLHCEKYSKVWGGFDIDVE